MRISLSAEAQAEVIEAVDWCIGLEAYTAAEQLALRLEHALALLIEFPRLIVPGPSDTRALPLHGFPYSLIYRVYAADVRIIAFAYHRRRPVYWTGRR
ncbi:MAG: type II toxin-antitoxin system RelE/ParE family toxin [Thiobacillaceae bacterium]|nr:type II toxin-antitoxin system RelE/ParE family toxin [Thiobacillaceae bacterium]MDW8324705.1 type II toxin-antitoxin system RelE/ParE family toxin [Burkholderiales bacterium]